MIGEFFSLFSGGVVGVIFSVIFNLLPFLLPPILFVTAFSLYIQYKRLAFISTREAVLLEIVLPQEVDKSPVAMELVLNALNQATFGTLAEVYIDGQVRPWFSLEIISNGGHVRMFIWTWVKFEHLVKHHLYSQYPEVEVRVAPDYTKTVLHNPTERFIWVANYKLAKEDTLPIKTYVDYGLDKDPKEEYKIDPMTPILEFLGSIGPKEKVWIQILIQAHKPTTWKEGDWSTWSLFEKDKKTGKRTFKVGNKTQEWKDRVDDVVKDIREKAEIKGADDKPSFRVFEPGQDDQVKALRRHQGKPAFDSLIRGVYIAEEGAINGANISGLIGAFKQYAGSNQIRLGKFSDFSDNKKDVIRLLPFLQKHYKKVRWKMEEMMFDAYKKRSIFQPPYKNYEQNPYVFSAEELASLFHVIGSVSRTPTVERLESKKSEPPPNLPV